ncbi:unnamed protein product [Parnassius apollo]|uniref:(apollo) hypothetical protein n=1 Tax=Parnassius apollo TaxID=110799 RepID=A0A8S3XE41_PARAO|nr:unnamed protein product [Parnassius apollo]
MTSRRAHKILELVSSSSSLSLQSHEVKPIAETHNATVEDLNNIPSENIENLPPNKNLTDLRSTDGQVQFDDHKKLKISLVSSCDEILSENADDHLHFSQKIDSRLISSRNIENKSCDTNEKRLPTSLVPDYDSDDYNNLECVGVQQDITKKKTQPQSSSSSTSTSSSSSSSSSSGTSSDSDDSSSSKTKEEPENRNTVAVMASEYCDSDNIQLRPQRCPCSNKSINISSVYTDTNVTELKQQQESLLATIVYYVLTIDQKSKHIFPVKETTSNIIHYAGDSELYDILHEAHIRIGHGGRDRMMKEVWAHYKSITQVTKSEEDPKVSASELSKENTEPSQVFNDDSDQSETKPQTPPYVLQNQCSVCSQETKGAHIGRECGCAIHSIWAAAEESPDEGFGSEVLCPLCSKNLKTLENRQSVKINLQQAEKMMKSSEKKFPPIPVSTSVRIVVPEVDRECGDSRNIIGVVLAKTDDELYQIGTKNRIIKQLYSRSQINVCPRVLLDVKNVPSKKTALRSVSNLQSIGIGQGFKKCLCKKNCSTARCIYYKNKLLCTSKCHSSLPCKNK